MLALAVLSALGVDVSGAVALTRHRKTQLGDLIVMGESCQRTWEQAIPTPATPNGPPVSNQVRPRGVR